MVPGPRFRDVGFPGRITSSWVRFSSSWSCSTPSNCLHASHMWGAKALPRTRVGMNRLEDLDLLAWCKIAVASSAGFFYSLLSKS